MERGADGSTLRGKIERKKKEGHVPIGWLVGIRQDFRSGWTSGNLYAVESGERMSGEGVARLLKCGGFGIGL